MARRTIVFVGLSSGTPLFSCSFPFSERFVTGRHFIPLNRSSKGNHGKGDVHSTYACGATVNVKMAFCENLSETMQIRFRIPIPNLYILGNVFCCCNRNSERLAHFGKIACRGGLMIEAIRDPLLHWTKRWREESIILWSPVRGI